MADYDLACLNRLCNTLENMAVAIDVCSKKYADDNPVRYERCKRLATRIRVELQKIRAAVEKGKCAYRLGVRTVKYVKRLQRELSNPALFTDADRKIMLQNAEDELIKVEAHR